LLKQRYRRTGNAIVLLTQRVDGVQLVDGVNWVGF
jgi:hypothetical protein